MYMYIYVCIYTYVYIYIGTCILNNLGLIDTRLDRRAALFKVCGARVAWSTNPFWDHRPQRWDMMSWMNLTLIGNPPKYGFGSKLWCQ